MAVQNIGSNSLLMEDVYRDSSAGNVLKIKV
jgi:hypothetical protein